VNLYLNYLAATSKRRVEVLDQIPQYRCVAIQQAAYKRRLVQLPFLEILFILNQALDLVGGIIDACTDNPQYPQPSHEDIQAILDSVSIISMA
jgi:hypothetical protein